MKHTKSTTGKKKRFYLQFENDFNLKVIVIITLTNLVANSLFSLCFPLAKMKKKSIFQQVGDLATTIFAVAVVAVVVVAVVYGESRSTSRV